MGRQSNSILLNNINELILKNINQKGKKYNDYEDMLCLRFILKGLSCVIGGAMLNWLINL